MRFDLLCGKKTFKYGFLPLVIIAIVVIVFYCFPTHNKIKKHKIDYENIKAQLQSGDIILRAGIGLWSDLIKSRNSVDKRYSHVGVVKVVNGNFFVIHSSANDLNGKGFVKKVSLEEYVNKSTGIAISRLKTLSAKDFLENVENNLNKPFDWQFNREEQEALYCTELVECSLQKIDPNIRMQTVRDIIMPESCLDTNLFQIIDCYEFKMER